MKKKIPIVGRVAAIILFLGSLPWFLNWIATGGMKAKFSAHYLAGASRIVGFCGASDFSGQLLNEADSIHFNRDEINIKYSDKEELLVLRTFVARTDRASIPYLGTSYGHSSGGIFSVDFERGKQAEYKKHLVERLDSFRKSRDSIQILTIEEFVRLNDYMDHDDDQKVEETWDELQKRLSFTLKWVGPNYYTTWDRCMMNDVIEMYEIFSSEELLKKYATKMRSLRDLLIVDEFVDSLYMSENHQECTINSWIEGIKARPTSTNKSAEQDAAPN
jgi:hypothetical protein